MSYIHILMLALIPGVFRCAYVTEIKQIHNGEVFYPADVVIVAAGMKGLQAEAAAFAASAPLFYQVGDCLAATNIYDANRLGFNAAMEIGTRW